MPSVIDTPVGVEHDTHALQDEQPQVRGACSGFWQRLVQSVRRHRVHPSSRTQSSARSARRQRESSMACEAPEPRTIYLLGFWGLHNG
jgi:hypothetical protein